MAHLFISLCGLNLEVDGSPVLEEVAADYLNLGVAIFDVDGGLILAFNFSSLASAVLILKLMLTCVGRGCCGPFLNLGVVIFDVAGGLTHL